MRRLVLSVLFGVAISAWPSSARALPIVVDFEALADGELLIDQIAGLSFTNTAVATAGISLNELELPPRSGTNVVFDAGSPLQVNFVDGVTSVGAYFTYFERVLLTAFDADGHLLGSASSQFVNNSALFGDAGSLPNELIQLTFASIAYITIAGGVDGGSFTMDDLTFETVASVPEPATLSLLLVGTAAAMRWRRGRSVAHRV